MFEENDTKIAPPPNLPVGEPEDMFAGVEKEEAGPFGGSGLPQMPDALTAGVLKKKQPEAEVMPEVPGSSAPALETTYTMKTPVIGKIIGFVILAVVLGGLGFGGWWLYAAYWSAPNPAVEIDVAPDLPAPPSAATVPEPAPVSGDATAPSAVTATSDVSTKMQSDSILFGEAVDIDKDGLDDVREREIGTDPTRADSDDDRLSDGDEVIIWKTNPLDADSDDDTHADGKEVSFGYNPLGSGRLITATSTGAATTTQ